MKNVRGNKSMRAGLRARARARTRLFSLLLFACFAGQLFVFCAQAARSPQDSWVRKIIIDTFTTTNLAEYGINYPVRSYRAINLGGPTVNNAGLVFEASGTAPSFSATGTARTNSLVTLVPAASADLATVVRSSLLNYAGGTYTFTNAPADTYLAYITAWSPMGQGYLTMTLNGSGIMTNQPCGGEGLWDRYGPFEFITLAASDVTLTSLPTWVQLCALELYAKVDYVAPSVTVTAPLPGATLLGPTNLAVACSPESQGSTITRVAWLLNGAEVAAQSAAPWTNVLLSLPAGTYLLSATAMDDRSSIGTSPSVAFTVTEPPNLPPLITLIAPTNGQIYTTSLSNPPPSQVITLAATASDPDGAVSNVTWYAGSLAIASDASSPYTGAWSTYSGTFAIRATATDADGLQATSSMATITVTNIVPVNKPPTVSFTAPTNGATFTAPVILTLAAAAADVDGSISNVVFYRLTGTSTNLLGTDTSSPYLIVTTNALLGTTYYYAVAQDNAAVRATSTVSVIVIPPPNQAPLVTLTAPTNGASFTAPVILTIAASASDADGSIVSVAFWSNATSLGTDTNAPYQVSVTNTVAGSYIYTAVATDNQAAAATNRVTITVNVAPVTNNPPTITFTAPANGVTFTNPAVFSLAVTAADPGGSVSNVTFYRSGIALGVDSSVPYSLLTTNATTATWTYSAVAQDNLALKATSTVSVIVIDPPATNTWPTVVITAPTNGTTFTAPVTVTFSATATDSDGTIAFVAFYAPGLVATDTSAPYSTSVSFGAGAYPLTAVATDNLGAKATNAISIAVAEAPNKSPAVYIAQPASGSVFTYPALVTVLATAGDSDGTITSLVIRTNGVQAASGTSPLTASLSLGAGSWQLAAVATDDDGASTSTNVTVTIQNPPNVLPTITMTSPAGGATYYAPATVLMSATASDSDGSVASVLFFRNSTLLGTDYSAPYAWTNTAVPVGDYWFGGMVTDNRGGTATNMVYVKVLVDVPPVVTLTSPTNGTTFTGPLDIPLAATATADGSKTITGVVFYRGLTSLTNDTSAPYAYTDAAVGVGSYVYSAVATDSNAVKSTNQVSVSVATTPVNIPPTVYFTSPTNGTTFLL
jgi:hypothetical protein